MKIKYLLIIISLGLFAANCTNKSTSNEINAQTDWSPSMGNTIKFWDGFNFADTATVNSKKMMEWMNTYMRLLQEDTQEVLTSINHSLDMASKDSLGYASFTNVLKTYIYNPNSPYRNDEWYIPVLEHIVSSDKASEGTRERAKFELEMVKNNRVGEKAVDFTYTLASGKSDNLYNIKAENLLIFFYNPDCDTCHELMTRINLSSVIYKATTAGLLKILAFYPDEDISAWEMHKGEVPEKWINSYDKKQAVLTKRLYDLKAIPSLYLLDKDKTVILKDADINAVEKTLFDKHPLIMGQ